MAARAREMRWELGDRPEEGEERWVGYKLGRKVMGRDRTEIDERNRGVLM
jgi:hypothetical protein